MEYYPAVKLQLYPQNGISSCHDKGRNYNYNTMFLKLKNTMWMNLGNMLCERKQTKKSSHTV